MYGWTGQRLRVYLTEGKVVKEPLTEELSLEYLGGHGLNAKVLLDEVRPSTEPLSPDNVFVVGVGPLVGTPTPAAARWTATAKSPITGGFGDGNGGGHFAPALKFAGYDQIIFHGRSPKPVYLLIDDDWVELRDASHLWGKTISETHSQLVSELRTGEICELSIGPAAENLVLITKVFSDSRAGGKGGMGAIAGSKNLKAVVVRGTKSVKVARPAEFFNTAKYAYKKIMASPFQKNKLREGGSLNWTRDQVSIGSLPTRNAQSGYFDGWEKITEEAFLSQYQVKHQGCFACPIQCSHYFQVKEGPYATYGSNAQYGTIYPFTAKLGIDRLDFALRATVMCDELGLDTHLCGATIAFAMEAWQHGLLTSEDTDGLDLSWGNAEAVLQLLPKIAHREGFGNLLASGSKKASAQIKGSDVCLVQTKGMDVSHMYPGPGQTGSWYLAYSTSARGPDHLRGSGGYGIGNPKLTKILEEEGAKALLDSQNYKGQGISVALSNHFAAIVHSLGICGRATIMYGYDKGLLDEDDLAELFSAATGVDINGNDLMKAGERIVNVERSFNIREKFGRKDDFPPERFFFEGVAQGPVQGPTGINRAKYEEMLDEYYEFNGWDREGIPTKAKLNELNLGYVAEQLGL